MLSLGVAPLLPAAAEAVEGDLANSSTLVGVTPEEAVTPGLRFNRTFRPVTSLNFCLSYKQFNALEIDTKY